ncbi:NCS2 family permease, partial [Streptococcus hyovaginalis]
MLIAFFTFLIVSFFDTAVGLISLTGQAVMMKDNKSPNIGKGLLADSVAGAIGAILGTST